LRVGKLYGLIEEFPFAVFKDCIGKINVTDFAARKIRQPEFSGYERCFKETR
jgi:hypothetical protein